MQGIALSLAYCLLLCFSSYAAFASAPAEETAGQQNQKRDEQQQRKPQVSTTRHVLTTETVEVGYTAEAGELIVSVDGGRSQGRFFYVYYRTSNDREEQRPLSFVFNGGPGAASVWLHLGGLGPRIIALNRDGTLPAPPVRLMDNEATWLRFTDLVFIDPIGTGYSRSLEESGSPFWGLNEDVRSVGEFIRLFLTEKQRWLSPLFLVGESYGTTRAAALSDFVLQRYGIWLNGIVLVSPVLDYSTIAYDTSMNLPYALVLPSLAATSAYYRRMREPGRSAADELLTQAQNYALSDYLTGLNQGSSLSAEDREELFERVSFFSGLPLEVVKQVGGRVSVRIFVREFFRDQGLVLGRMDTTIRGIDPAPESPFAYQDPSLVPLFGPFSSAAHAYIRSELRYVSDSPYEFLSDEVGAGWDWSGVLRQRGRGQGYVDVTGDLKSAMSRNPSLKVLVASGYYDLATPYFAVLHTLRQMGLDERIRSNIVFRPYHAGHMIYLHADARQALFDDTIAFFEQVLTQSRLGLKPLPDPMRASSFPPRNHGLLH
jgi:carboxypeptidase C (cathepsin A)